MKVKIKDTDMYLDGILKTNLDTVKANIKKDWDYLFICDGEVGSGKSVFVQQLAWYLSDGNLRIDQICFDPKQFKEAILKAKKYEAVIFDEAFRGMSARAAMTQTNRILMGMLQEIRQKNLFVFIVLPSVWDVDKYVSFHRCKGIFNVYTDSNKRRGFFRFYKPDIMRNVLTNSKLRYQYPKYSSFRGRFTKYYPLGKEEYDNKKTQSLGDYGYDKEKDVSDRDRRSAKFWKDTCLIMKQAIKEKTSVSFKTICSQYGMNYGTMSHLTTESGRKGKDNLQNEPRIEKEAHNGLRLENKDYNEEYQ